MPASNARAGADPATWGRLHYVKVDGRGMVPRVPDDAWVGMEAGAEAAPGDVVVVRGGDGLRVAELGEWNGQRWLVELQGRAPVPLVPPLEVVGVARLVVYTP